MKITVPRLKAYKMKISEIYWQAVRNKCLNSARSSFGFEAKNASRTETLKQRDDKVVRRMPRVWNARRVIVQKGQNLKYKQLDCLSRERYHVLLLLVMEKYMFSIWKVDVYRFFRRSRGRKTPQESSKRDASKDDQSCPPNETLSATDGGATSSIWCAAAHMWQN